MQAHVAYSTRLEHARRNLVQLDRRGALLANLRTVTFLSASGLALAVIFNALPRAALGGVAASLVAFVVLAVIHARVIHEESKKRVLAGLNERGIARLEHRWQQFAETGTAFLTDGHLYATDLDVVGPGSLFQRIDETGTLAGAKQLAQWLLHPDATPAATARQRASHELTPLLDFRQALISEARLAGQAKADPSRFIAWCETPSQLVSIRWAFFAAHLLAPATVLAVLGSMADILPSMWAWALLGVQLAVVTLTRSRLKATYDALMLGDQGFVRFEETFTAIERQSFSDPTLVNLKAGMGGGAPVTERLRRFTRLLGFAALRQSPQIHPFVNALTLWDVHVLFRLDAWRAAQGAQVRRWFEALAQLEALSSIAGYAFETPKATFPTLVDGERGQLQAVALRHPLLANAVGNDVTLAAGEALMITGSNMSGKTTLMRAMGLTVVMARAGMPVCCQALRVSGLAVVTSMRVKDSLERGVSYFFAEVQRIRALLAHVEQQQGHALFLLDELFMGTNTKERQLASKHLVRVLLDRQALGAMTTHDLTLCELADERPAHVQNVHFRDAITNGEMTFDYRLRPGIVTTTNALEVLRRAGVPVPAQEP